MLTNEAFMQLLKLPKSWSIERMAITTNPEEARVWLTIACARLLSAMRSNS